MLLLVAKIVLELVAVLYTIIMGFIFYDQLLYVNSFQTMARAMWLSSWWPLLFCEPRPWISKFLSFPKLD